MADASHGTRIANVLRAFGASAAAGSSRNGRVNVVLFAMPVFVLTFVGLAIRGYSSPTYFVGVHSLAASAAAEPLLHALARDPNLSVREYEDPEALRLAVYRGRMHIGVRLGPDWEARDGLDVWLAQAGAGAPVARTVVERALLHTAGWEHPAEIAITDGDTLAAPPVGYRFTAPGQLVFFVLLNGIVSSAGILALRRTGIGRRLLATPLRPAQLLLGLAVGPLQIIIVQALFLIGITMLFFGVPWGDPIGVVIVTVGLVATAVGLTLLASTLFPSDQVAASVGPFLGVLLGMVGGCMWPLTIVPESVATFALGFPSTWAMNGYLALGLGDASWREAMPSALVLFAMAAAFIAIGLVRLRGRLGG